MKIIGHRGARGLAPENTIAALRKALEHGVDEIEFDVRVTSDNVPVLLHDPDLIDAAGNRLIIAGCTYAELLSHKPDLTTLEAAIGFVNGKVPLLIEVKPKEPAGPIAKVILGFLNDGWPPEKFSLSSFSQKTLRELHHAMPEIETVVVESWAGIRARWRARQLRTKRINMCHSALYSWYIRGARRSGYQLAVYTLNDAQKARAWAKNGLYGVITDFPDRFER